MKSVRDLIANARVLACALIGFATLSSIAQASETDAGQAAFTACSQATSFRAFPNDVLLNVGWTQSSEIGGDDLQRTVDGIIAAMSGTREDEIVWTEAEQSAQDAASAMARFVPGGGVKAFVHHDLGAVLLIGSRPHDAFHIVHCIYGGPLGAETASLTETLHNADERAGITQTDEELHLFTIRSQSQSDATPPKVKAIDAQIGVFQTSTLPDLGRETTVELGMSIFSYTQK